jgi:hypothetical protein
VSGNENYSDKGPPHPNEIVITITLASLFMCLTVHGQSAPLLTASTTTQTLLSKVNSVAIAAISWWCQELSQK